MSVDVEYKMLTKIRILHFSTRNLYDDKKIRRFWR